MAFEERDFFKQKFTVDELKQLLGRRPVKDVFAAKSPSVKKLGLDAATMTDAEMLEWIVKEPRLLRRPLLVADGQIVVQPKDRDLDTLLK
ncbi:MAG: hypothetical protein EXR52_07040 [Dehalococcoidia bacterium]|nr:hypothetical protein [Dehalococcoidia bacterium]